jgi:hypothetical protein
MTPLDDATAIQILTTVAQARLRPAAPDIAPTPDVRAALAAAFDNPAPAPTAASEGDLARAALDLLAQDPAFAESIRIMASQPSAASQRYFEPVSTIVLTTAALLVLQTRVKFKRDHTGKWSFEIDKKALSDGTLKSLVQHLLSSTSQM